MHWKSLLSRVFLPVFLLLLFLAAVTSGLAAEATVRNVIVLVPDGMSLAHTTIARWYQGGKPLALDEMVSGLVRTYSADSLITDSAPAATAFATGFKSNTKYVSVLPSVTELPVGAPQSNAFQPVASVLEAAKLLGKSTGLIATSNIQHATPACYAAHWFNRGDYNEISEQMVYQNIDVVLGGGKKYLLPKELGGMREDQANLVNTLKEMGYDFVENTGQMNASSALKLWGMFADDAMAYDFDRDSTREPSLADMTRKALSVLSKNPKGFFLFVEGSKIDWASHANDPIGVVSDVLAFDAAVKAALEFAKKDGNTLVIAFTDHGNGGMSIGNSQTDRNYDTLKLKALIEPLKKATVTGEGLERYFNADRSNIADVMAKHFGIADLKPEELEAIRLAKTGYMTSVMNSVVGPMISRRSSIGWTTFGHTGEDVTLYTFGPGRPFGTIENTDIARIIDSRMGLGLSDVNRKLFVRLNDTRLEWAINALDDKNPVITIRKGSAYAEFPASTNLMLLNGKTYYLHGLSLFIKGYPYVPAEALEIMETVLKK